MNEHRDLRRRLRRVRWLFVGIYVAMLLGVYFGFERFGGDCGDAPTSAGTDAFQCNAPAYVLMALAAIAALGLLGTGIWVIIDWALRIRERRTHAN